MGARSFIRASCSFGYTTIYRTILPLSPPQEPRANPHSLTHSLPSPPYYLYKFTSTSPLKLISLLFPLSSKNNHILRIQFLPWLIPSISMMKTLLSTSSASTSSTTSPSWRTTASLISLPTTSPKPPPPPNLTIQSILTIVLSLMSSIHPSNSKLNLI